MTDPKLVNPRKLFNTKEFLEQKQTGLTLQSKMSPKPDCGEESYVGNSRLLNRRVLITGGDSGIGRAVAIAFAREGADIALNFLPGEEEDAKEVADFIEKAGRKVYLLPYDLKKAFSPKKIVEEAYEKLGGLDTLVLNAAQQIAHEKLADYQIEDVKETFQVNVISLFAVIQAAEKYLPEGGCIINTTSVQAFDPAPHLLDYAGTKSAIANLTISLGKYFVTKGIRVNAIAPGPIWTPLQLNLGHLKGQLKGFGQDAPMGRAGQPVELSPLYVYLASNEASYVTGQIFGVTGGKRINL